MIGIWSFAGLRSRPRFLVRAFLREATIAVICTNMLRRLTITRYQAIGFDFDKIDFFVCMAKPRYRVAIQRFATFKVLCSRSRRKFPGPLRLSSRALRSARVLETSWPEGEPSHRKQRFQRPPRFGVAPHPAAFPTIFKTISQAAPRRCVDIHRQQAWLKLSRKRFRNRRFCDLKDATLCRPGTHGNINCCF